MVIHLGNHLHTGDRSPLLLARHVNEFCHQTSYEECGERFGQPALAISSDVGHEPTVHEFGGQKRDESDSECNSEDTSPGT